MRFARVKPFIVVVLILLPLLSISCLAISGSKQPSPTPIPASTEAVDELEEEVESAVATAQSGGPIQMVITEQQLTSMAAVSVQSNPDANVKDVQVRLRDGQIQISGQAESRGFDLPLSIVLEISVDAGRARSKVITATVGPFSLPDSMLEQLTAQLDQALMGQFIDDNMIIDSITIADGKMIVEGHMP